MIMATLLASIAIVETGDAKHPNGNPNRIGRDGERSAYQISWKVWRTYTRQPFNAKNTADPNLSCMIAEKHVYHLNAQVVGLQPPSFGDRRRIELIAAAWNAGPSYVLEHERNFERYSIENMSPRIRDYAERVVNTYEQLRREGR